MGNWRTVWIVGKMAPEHVQPLIKALTCPGYRVPLEAPEWRDFVEGPLAISHGICGLNEWPAAEMNRVGNLFERDYSVEDVAEHLKKMVCLAPSMNLKIHCGDEREALNCVATICLIQHHVSIQKPEVETLPEISEDQIRGGFLDALRNA